MADERRDRGQNRPEGQRSGNGSRPQGENRQGEAHPQGEGRGRRFGKRRSGRSGESHQADARPQDGRGGNGQGSNANQGRDSLNREAQARDSSGRKEGGQQRQSAAPRQELPPLPKMDPVTCPLCGKPVYDLSTALSAEREKPAPAHFDCVVERVTAAENLGANERLVYLGSGAFGVVEFKDKSETAFVVKRRVQWEKEGEKQDWRKALSARIAHI